MSANKKKTTKVFLSECSSFMCSSSEDSSIVTHTSSHDQPQTKSVKPKDKRRLSVRFESSLAGSESDTGESEHPDRASLGVLKKSTSSSNIYLLERRVKEKLEKEILKRLTYKLRLVTSEVSVVTYTSLGYTKPVKGQTSPLSGDLLGCNVVFVVPAKYRLIKNLDNMNIKYKEGLCECFWGKFLSEDLENPGLIITPVKSPKSNKPRSYFSIDIIDVAKVKRKMSDYKFVKYKYYCTFFLSKDQASKVLLNMVCNIN